MKKELRDYQKKAINKLGKHYLNNDKGMLILPTGGGKTFTAAKFVSKMFDSKQWERESTIVIWLAHTIELIKQTKEAFETEFGKERIAIISSQLEHTNWEALNKDRSYNDKNLIFSSYLSCSKVTKRKGSRKKDHSLDEMKAFVKKSKAKNVFLVIDEAHRTTAKTYRNILDGLNDLKKQKNELTSVKLLGLTATPIRMSRMEQEALHHLFDSNKIYEISTLELQNQGVLSKLYSETVPTGNNETDFFQEDYELLKTKLDKHKSLTNDMLSKIGKSFTRNQLIVDHYVDNLEKYGPTLVFATSINHCEALVDCFKKAEIHNCAAVHSGDDKDSITHKLSQFKTGKIDVLINVNMLTEGVDIPNAKTAFLTRPTNSEALLRQMVGRVLRGEASKGTEIAYAVDFKDAWDKFSPISAGYLFKGENHELEDKEYNTLLLQEKIPIKIILEIGRMVKQMELTEDSTSHIPENYYCWKKEEEGEILNGSLITYDNWDDALTNIIRAIEANPDVKIDKNQLSEKLGKCKGPIPRNERDFNNVFELLEVIQNVEDYEVFSLKEITQWSPSKILERFEGKDLMGLGKEIKELYSSNDFLKSQYSSAKALYSLLLQAPTKEDDKFEFNTDYKQWTKPNKDYEIDEVYNRVIKSNCENDGKFEIQKDKLGRLEKLYSSAPNLPTSWGFCQEEPYFDQKINVVLSPRLNAPDIPLMFLEFIMYHELVHVQLGTDEGHSPLFRKWEKMFKPTIKAINDLRNNFLKYNKKLGPKYSFYDLCRYLQYKLNI